MPTLLRAHAGLLGLLGFLAMAASCHSSPRFADRREQGIHDFTGTYDLVLETGSTQDVQLDYTIEATSGSWRTELLAPSGASSAATAASLPKQQLTARGAAGRWIARFHFTQFSGGYRASLKNVAAAQRRE